MGILDKVLEQYNGLDDEHRERRTSERRRHGEPRVDPTDPDYPVNVIKALRGNIVGKPGRPSRPEAKLARVRNQERRRLQQLLRPLRGNDPRIPMTFDQPRGRR